MKNFAPEPPETLSAEACSIWSSIRDEYDISDKAGIVILSAAAEAFDRMRSAQKLIENEGMTTKDRFGQDKVHPAVLIERDSRAAMLAALKQLNLDLEPLRDRPGRPSGSQSGGIYAFK